MFLRLLADVRWRGADPKWRSVACCRSASGTAESQPVPLPAQAQVVICGGGITGTSVAYHLAKLGWKDVVLLEQGRLAAGTTRFCAGIVSTARPVSIELKMAEYSNKLYQQLEQETGVQTGYVKTGSVSLAQTQDRLISLKRIASSLTVSGIPCEIISPKQVAQLHPLINIHDLVGAMYVPEDALVLSANVSLALATAASRSGVQIHERTSVSHVSVQKGRVTGVETDRGHIKCQYFVNCAGQWAYELGHSGEEPVNIPLHACEHFYLLTHPLKEPLANNVPTVVDPDGRIYIRNWQGGILSGGFEKNPKPLFTEGRNQLEIHNLQEDWDHFEPLLSSLLRRMPNLEALQIMQLVNCPESFTPDMRCIMGESPTVRGYFVLAGMNSAGISYGGGAGKYLAEWMVNGYPSENVWPLDLKRFGTLQSSRTFLRHRVMEVMPVPQFPFLPSAEAFFFFPQGMEFVGQEALLEQKQNGVYKRFTMFILEDHDTDMDLWPWWGEPIFRNGRYVGKTTSSAYSYTLERHVCLGFVQHFNEKTGEELVVTTDFINQGEYEIDIAGQRFQAKAKLYPFSSLFAQRRRKDEVELSGYQRDGKPV
uniref:Pyruvate dehydrogenase phosphatase regulatory subunit n=1 Tax=Pavo cristatus TaxID=9049 RepID=A0A8C9GBC5_PAVCR